jgi:hypothetical protein
MLVTQTVDHRATNTKKPRETTNVLDRYECIVANEHNTLKFPYDSSKTFTFKLRVLRFLGQAVIRAGNLLTVERLLDF